MKRHPMTPSQARPPQRAPRAAPAYTAPTAAPKAMRSNASLLLSPQQVLQLQRTLGNQRTQHLVAPAPRRGGRGSPQGAMAAPVLQRKLKFKPDQLTGKVSKTAALKGAIGQASTFAKIERDLKKYWTIEDGSDTEAAHLKRLELLRSLYENASKWMAELRDQSKTHSTEDFEKKPGIEKLLNALNNELPDEEYRAKYGGIMNTPEVTNSVLDATTSVSPGNFSYAKLHGRQIKQGQMPKLNPDQLKDLKNYKDLKAQGITKSEMAAIYAYTGDNYHMMNPAAAGNRDWLKANMARFGKGTSDKQVETAMKVNKDLNAAASSGLEKLPDWKQTQVLYRGETVTADEYYKMDKGYRKHFPHYVSTSLERQVPFQRIKESITKERPFKVIYHITDTSSKPGKDIAVLAKSKGGETEILFPINTSFVIEEVIVKDRANKLLEVKAKTL